MPVSSRPAAPASRASRRRRRGRRGRRHNRGAWLVVGLVVLILLAVGGLLALDAMRTRAALAQARAQIEGARTALVEGDVDGATNRLAVARDVIDSADARTNRALWTLGERVPVAGRSFVVISDIVDVADTAVAAGIDLVGAFDRVIAPGGTLRVEVGDGKVDLAPLEAAREALVGVAPGPLERARASLAAGPSTWVLPQVRSARRDALGLAEEALQTLEHAHSLVDVLPRFMGREEPRSYLLAMQTSAELRGTGGLIGLFAVVTVDDGRFVMSEPEVYNVLDRAPEERQELLTPVQTSEEFIARYSHLNAAGYLANSNVDPDLPTSAPIVLALHERFVGQHVDGMIVVDPVGLGTILEAIGPVDVPDVPGIAPGAMPDPVAPDEVARVSMVDVYDVLGGSSNERKEYQRVFARAAFDRIFAADWDAVRVSQQVARAAANGHLQLYSRDDKEQNAFRAIGVAGEMAPRARDDDLLAVTANNAAGNKSDVHVAHRITGALRVRLDADGNAERTATLRTEVDNPLSTTGHDLYIIGSSSVSTSSPTATLTGPRGLNRTWFTAWAPDDTALIAGRDGDGEPVTLGVGEIHSLHAYDHYLETSARSVNGFEVDLEGPVTLGRDGPDLVYRMTWWRQSKAIPDRIDLTIDAPEGWTVAASELEGGGDGTGMGPDGEPGPTLELRTEAGQVRVVGDATRTFAVEVRFTRPFVDRFWDWLRAPAL